MEGHPRASRSIRIGQIAGQNADDAAWLPADINKLHHRIGPIHVAIDGVLRWEHAFCERFADDNDRLFALAVERIEVTARNDGNA